MAVSRVATPAPDTAESHSDAAAYGVHLVGSIPLASAAEVFETLAGRLGDRLRRVPDGETGPRADWIVWQYPVLSSRPQFEVAPPVQDQYRPLPKLRLKDGERAENVHFGELGYASAAKSSYRIFAGLKRDGKIPAGCRFQVALPTPLAPVSAFIAADQQAAVEPIYEARLLQELAEILDVVPHDQLAIQWDANFEFGMLEGVFPAWFSEVRAGIMERLLRLSRHVPADVELGYHLCYGDTHHQHFKEPEDARKLVLVANGLSSSLDRPLNWVHMPVPRGRTDPEYFAPLADLRLRSESELYLGLVHLSDGAAGTRRRIEAAVRVVQGFGVATECGWGRRPAATIPELMEVHVQVSQPFSDGTSAPSARFHWPDGVARVPDEEWTRQPVDTFGLAYDTVEHHGWYRNLDRTVEDLTANLADGQILVDYSGGTGILLDRLRLRIFDRQVGMMIVDSSPKFLRVAVDKFRADERVAMRLIRYLKDRKRLQYMDEVFEPPLLERGVDAIVSTNAIHLYQELEETLRSWYRVLRSGAKVFINSGNIRNPSARPNEWILDETVWVIHEVAEGLVRTDPRYAKYRPALDDGERMRAHMAHRDRVFLAPRPLDFYLDELKAVGFVIDDLADRTIQARVDDWYELMSAYHEAVLGWIGGSVKVDGRPAAEDAVQDRLDLIRHSMEVLFGGRHEFKACWTYITAHRP
ncbi:MAG: class I SAM-dependent methyltransferase [Candidatus Dormibacteraeota bacterium]|nr:class I SAM-dependent methyltransferase [Candidatus Dormibacteraeota bacterium]